MKGVQHKDDLLRAAAERAGAEVGCGGHEGEAREEVAAAEGTVARVVRGLRSARRRSVRGRRAAAGRGRSARGLGAAAERAGAEDGGERRGALGAAAERADAEDGGEWIS
ncbi:hypothetical protein GUJ93_ZPchr0011g26933 [Zizania palustris]|uniref:Uncharacterized protein n=1 Tax=Zizania palustris TaxID=103762 RepID=A0A8J5WJB7_ZIZPA|nr:hypothetical protein GUJ93_ZPchr0011g26933 [Zizania palustris]